MKSKKTDEEEHLERLIARLEQLTSGAAVLLAEHTAMKERLVELEEITEDDDGTLRWSASGSPVSDG